VTTTTSAAGHVERTWLDRFLLFVPVAVPSLVALSILFWQAASMKSPVVFGDELEWTMISRAIAHTGQGARLGEPSGFRSLFAYVIAPAWWLHSTQASYTAIKYLDTVVMAAAAIPTYLIARTMVRPGWAFAAALGTMCTSALFYASLILPEALAYPAFAVAAYASVQALAGRGRRWWIAAVVLSFLAVAVRTELAAAVGALALAAAWLWIVGPRGAQLRRSWGVLQYAGAVIGLVAVALLLNRYVGSHVHQWSYTTHNWQGRIWHFGFESASALAIGLGVLPMIAGLASMWLPERRHDPHWRAFAAYLAASIVTFGTYTGVKAAYISTQIFTRVEERNLIYLQPLLLVGTIVLVTTRRTWLPGMLAATGFVAYLVIAYGYQLGFPYVDSPGYGIAVMANRAFYWNQPDIRRALAVAVAISLAVLLVARARRVPAAVRTAVVGAALLTACVWMSAGEVTSARGSIHAARVSVANLPAPLDWIDRGTHGQGVTYLGQHVGDPTGLWLNEFWNHSIQHVFTLDGSGPGPGPTQTPTLWHIDGSMTGDPSLSYVVAESDVLLQEPVKEHHGGLTLYALPTHPWRLQQAVYGRTGDGWLIGTNDDPQADGSFAYFGPGHRAGRLTVQVGRQFCPETAPRTHATVWVGPLTLDAQNLPAIRHVAYRRRFVVPTCADKPSVRTLVVRIAPPFDVQVHVDHTIRPSDYGSSDARQLGAQVGYGFTRASKRP
jgi:hypothetical protein